MRFAKAKAFVLFCASHRKLYGKNAETVRKKRMNVPTARKNLTNTKKSESFISRNLI